MQASRAQHEILALRAAVLHRKIADGPAKFRGDNITARHLHIRTFPQGLDAVKPGIFDGDVFGIPQGGPAEFGHLRIPDDKAVIMPERIAQVKKAAGYLHIPALLKSALPVRRAVKRAVLCRNIPAAVQGTFLIKRLILNRSHNSNLLFVLSIPLHRKMANTYIL